MALGNGHRGAEKETQTRIISSGRFPKSVSWLETELPVMMSAESGNKDTELTELLLSWGRGDDLAQQKRCQLRRSGGACHLSTSLVATRVMAWSPPP